VVTINSSHVPANLLVITESEKKMIIQGKSEQFICADGKFFALYDFDDQGRGLYRQIESYMHKEDCGPGGLKEAEMNKRMAEWEAGKDFRWGIGSTGTLLTARYRIREEDGELVSLLSLNGGMLRARKGEVV
jgi:hypothetical protein